MSRYPYRVDMVDGPWRIEARLFPPLAQVLGGSVIQRRFLGFTRAHALRRARHWYIVAAPLAPSKDKRGNR